MNGIVIARDGEPALVTLSDRLRPPGIGFGVGWIHVYPPSIPPSSCARRARSRSSRCARSASATAIAFPQLIAAPDGRVAVVEVAARIPGGQMADLVRHAVGVDLVEIALRQALGEEVPDELALPRFTQPLAIRFFTAQPGPLPTGRVTRIGSLEPCSRRGSRPGGHVPRGWRDDPSSSSRRRSSRVRHRGGRLAGGGPRTRGGCSGAACTRMRGGRMSCSSTWGTTRRSSRRRRPAGTGSPTFGEAPGGATSSCATTSTSRSKPPCAMAELEERPASARRTS